MRLAAISMARNMSDIIEAFVRYNIQFLDRLYIINHASIDNTGEILRSLEREGAPLVVLNDSQLEFCQSDKLTALCHRVFEEFSPDFVLPLDADEFLVVKDRHRLESRLSRVPKNAHALIPWRTYVPTEGDDQIEANPLVRIVHRKEAESPQHFKAVVAESFHSGGGSQFLYFGSHGILSRDGPVAHSTLNDVHIAHFPVRDPIQIVCNIIVNWLAKLMIGPVFEPDSGTSIHQQLLFKKFIWNPKVSLQDLRIIAENYGSTESGTANRKLVLDPISCRFRLLYPQGRIVDPLVAAAVTAEQIALRHREYLRLEISCDRTGSEVPNYLRIQRELLRISQLEAELAASRSELATVYASKSWRLTAPFRRVMNWARRLSTGAGLRL